MSEAWPEVRQGIVRGAVMGGVCGPLLGAIASVLTQSSILPGVGRGLLIVVVGALAGGVVGLLRAQPAPRTVGAPSGVPLWLDALQGAIKGAPVGAALGALLVAQRWLDGPLEVPGGPVQSLILFALAGAVAGAIVQIIHAIPRDRGRRRPS